MPRRQGKRKSTLFSHAWPSQVFQNTFFLRLLKQNFVPELGEARPKLGHSVPQIFFTLSQTIQLKVYLQEATNFCVAPCRDQIRTDPNSSRNVARHGATRKTLFV
jgi:hypothetical protein